MKKLKFHLRSPQEINDNISDTQVAYDEIISLILGSGAGCFFGMIGLLAFLGFAFWLIFPFFL